MGYSSVVREAKCEGDEELVKVWKEHNSECHLMHQKIDVIAAKLGIPFYPVGRRQRSMLDHRRRVAAAEKRLVENV